jgi:hypothetical protein
LLRKELAEGRNVLIFLWHKELADRLIGLCREAGEVPAFLDANKVQAKKRQDWIDKNVVGKRRIMITNPSCVQTGLNNLIWFSSAVFFENPGCNPFVARQAVGRLDRITQTKEVRVYWPVYEGVQCALLDLLLTWFDNDDTGRAITQRYADALGERYQVGDMSPHYDGHEDLNSAHVANRGTGTTAAWTTNNTPLLSPPRSEGWRPR